MMMEMSFRYKPCRDGNGISIEASGRVEDVLFDGNDFRQNFNNGVCIANRGDFTRSTVTNNKFHNNGFGEPIAAGASRQAPYGDGFGVYHDFTVVNPGIAAVILPSIDGFRIENITFSGNDYRENGRFYQQFDIDGTGMVTLAEPTLALGSASSCALSARRSAGSASPTRSARRTGLAAIAWRRTRTRPASAAATSARSPGPTSRPSRARAIPPRAASALRRSTSHRRGQRQRRRHRPHHR
jgi:hypothetical protein